MYFHLKNIKNLSIIQRIVINSDLIHANVIKYLRNRLSADSTMINATKFPQLRSLFFTIELEFDLYTILC